MNKTLDEALVRDFPEIFKDRHGNVQTTAMCWGFECGDGWEPLIRAGCDQLMQRLSSLRSGAATIKKMLEVEDKSGWNGWEKTTYTEEHLAKKEAAIVEEMNALPIAVQVKEKFGGLRFYVHGANDEQYAIISSMEHMSQYVCEECGTMKGSMLYSMGWYKTLCPDHANMKYGTPAAEEYRNGKTNGNF